MILVGLFVAAYFVFLAFTLAFMAFATRGENE